MGKWGVFFVCLGLLKASDVPASTSDLHAAYEAMVARAIGQRSNEEIQALVQMNGSGKSCLWGVPDSKVPLPNSSGDSTCPAVELKGYDISAFVITLTSKPDRSENANCIISNLQKQIDDTNAGDLRIKGSIFPAVTSFNTPSLRSDGKLVSQGSLKKGEIGVYLSHVSIWQKVVDENIPAAMIFEDDASITVDLVPRLRESYSELPSSWDIMWLFESPSVKLNAELNRPPTPIACAHHIMNKGHGIGLDGYMVSRRGAERLLRMVLPIDNDPIDLKLHRLIQNREIDAYVTNPPLVYDDFHLKSEIQDRYYSELFGMAQPNYQQQMATKPAVKVDEIASLKSSTNVKLSIPELAAMVSSYKVSKVENNPLKVETEKTKTMPLEIAAPPAAITSKVENVIEQKPLAVVSVPKTISQETKPVLEPFVKHGQKIIPAKGIAKVVAITIPSPEKKPAPSLNVPAAPQLAIVVPNVVVTQEPKSVTVEDAVPKSVKVEDAVPTSPQPAGDGRIVTSLGSTLVLKARRISA